MGVFEELRRNAFVISEDGQRIPFEIINIGYCPGSIGPEIEGYLRFDKIDIKKPSDPIEKVIFNDPATIVIWKDKTKTVVKCQEGDTYSPELGLAMCIAKKYLGNKGNFNEVFKKWIPEEKVKETLIVTDIEGNVIKCFEKDLGPEPETSIEEMRRKLMDFCTQRYCDDCPIDKFPHKCGEGFTFIDSVHPVSDEEVKKSYKIVFGNKED